MPNTQLSNQDNITKGKLKRQLNWNFGRPLKTNKGKGKKRQTNNTHKKKL